MGVKHFKTILHAYGEGETVKVSHLTRMGIKRIAVDVLVYIYRLYRTNFKKDTISHYIVNALKKLKDTFYEHGIQIYLVRDGDNPKRKPNASRRGNVEITKRWIFIRIISAQSYPTRSMTLEFDTTKKKQPLRLKSLWSLNYS